MNQNDNFWIVWGISLVVCAFFLRPAAESLTSCKYLSNDARGGLAFLSIIPFFNAITALFALVVCTGNLVAYVTNKSSDSFK